MIIIIESVINDTSQCQYNWYCGRAATYSRLWRDRSVESVLVNLAMRRFTMQTLLQWSKTLDHLKPYHIGVRFAFRLLDFKFARPNSIVWSQLDRNGNFLYVPVTLLFLAGGIHNVFSFCILLSFFLSNSPRFPKLSMITNLFRWVKSWNFFFFLYSGT